MEQEEMDASCFQQFPVEIERRFLEIPESGAGRLSGLKVEFVQETESCYYGCRDELRFP